MSDPPLAPVTARGERWFLLLPALTFLVGLLLGGALVAVTFVAGDASDSDGTQSTDLPTTPSPQTSASDLTVTIPRSCVEAAELSEEVLDLADRAGEALRNLDAGELPALIADMEELAARVREAAEQCQDEAAGSAE